MIFLLPVSTTLLHLPFANRYFDVICSGSVFTHIEDLANTWLLEPRRILKPGGLLYVTIHDENTVRLLEKEQHTLSNNILSNEQCRKYMQACLQSVAGRIRRSFTGLVTSAGWSATFTTSSRSRPKLTALRRQR